MSNDIPDRSRRPGSFGLQTLVFSLVSAAFTNIYLIQPVLPVLQTEFGVDEALASHTVSAVILGMALSNLPFGRLSDRYPLKPILAIGGAVVTGCGLLCAAVPGIYLLIFLRFIQGLFIPAFTTCVAAYLARTLPPERLNVAMGSYVSATVVGGLGGRLLGGWVHPPLHWRYAFVSASVLVGLAAAAALLWLPRQRERQNRDQPEPGFVSLLKCSDLLRIYSVAFGAFFVFSSLFNYLPFYLAGPGFQASTRLITFMYMSYIVGVIVAPLSGKISNRLGNGATMVLGAMTFTAALAVTHIQNLWAVGSALAGVCAGFFAIHAAAVGSMNRRLNVSRGRSNALYILFYYLGGASGITLTGYGYQHFGWIGVTALGAAMLAVIFAAGVVEMRSGSIADNSSDSCSF